MRTESTADATTGRNAEPKAKSVGVGVAVLTAFGLFAGPSLLFFGFGPDVSGSLAADDLTGDLAFAPTVCSSGARFGYVGARLEVGGGPPYVHVMKDPVDGVRVSIESAAGSPPVVISRDDCRTLRIDVAENGESLHDVRGIEGLIVADCDALRGTVTFEDCY